MDPDKAIETKTLVPRPGPGISRLYLLAIEGNSSFVIPLPENGMITVGRGEEADVRLAEESASRRHARLIIAHGEARIVDLESHNGTYLNGERIEGTRELSHGDVVTIGDCSLVLSGVAKPAKDRSLTDLQSFRQRISEEVDRAVEYGRPLAVLALSLGTPARQNPELGRILDRQLRPVDIAGWIAATQLGILLPELESDGAAAVASLLTEALQSHFPALRLGIAVCPTDGSDADVLLAAARSAAVTAQEGAAAQASHSVGRLMLGDRIVVIAEPAMARVYELLKRLAEADLPVLISGETGVGKENAAFAIHHWSRRAPHAFTALNCAAIPENLIESELFGHEKGAFSGAVASKSGLLETTHQGTLFLDEIGELSAAVQAKLLRVIETKCFMRVGAVRERQVDLRLVAATHRDLEEDVAQGRFRKDLFFRLNAATVVLPPLRERPREIAVLARLFLEGACAAAGRPPLQISSAAMQCLARHPWPGNIRELKNAMDFAAAIAPGPELEPWHLPGRIGETAAASPAADGASEPEAVATTARFRPIADEVRELECRRMMEALDSTNGNKTQAAALLRMPLRTFVTKFKQYGLKRSDLTPKNERTN